MKNLSFFENSKKKRYFFFFWGGGRGWGLRRGAAGLGVGQGGCERIFGKIHKKKIWGGEGRGQVGSGWWGGGQGGCERNVGVGNDVGYGGVNQE